MISISAKNQLRGVIQEIHKGEVNCEIVIDIGTKELIYSIITLASAKELGLCEGMQITAVIKPNDVLVALS